MGRAVGGTAARPYPPRCRPPGFRCRGGCSSADNLEALVCVPPASGLEVPVRGSARGWGRAGPVRHLPQETGIHADRTAPRPRLNAPKASGGTRTPDRTPAVVPLRFRRWRQWPARDWRPGGHGGGQVRLSGATLRRRFSRVSTSTPSLAMVDIGHRNDWSCSAPSMTTPAAGGDSCTAAAAGTSRMSPYRRADPVRYMSSTGLLPSWRRRRWPARTPNSRAGRSLLEVATVRWARRLAATPVAPRSALGVGNGRFGRPAGPVGAARGAGVADRTDDEVHGAVGVGAPGGVDNDGTGPGARVRTHWPVSCPLTSNGVQSSRRGAWLGSCSSHRPVGYADGGYVEDGAPRWRAGPAPPG
jgi:hypothetical protein